MRNTFVQKLDVKTDSERVLNEIEQLISVYGWGTTNQLCLNHRENTTDQWFDGCGSRLNRETGTIKYSEYDFKYWNTDISEWLQSEFNSLIQTRNFKIGRTRAMLLRPKTGLSVHSDSEVRYHLVLQTNSYCYIAEDYTGSPRAAINGIRATCYHLPLNNHWYLVNTRQQHWVYNGGNTDRIHVVICGES